MNSLSGFAEHRGGCRSSHTGALCERSLQPYTREPHLDCHVRFVTRLNAAFEGRHGIGRYGIEIPHNVDGT